MRGIGEQVEAGARLGPVLQLLLVNPGFPLATAAVFRELPLDQHRSAFCRTPGGAGPPLAARSRNVLELPARALLQVIGEVLTALAAGIPGCRLARMSGSGATCFGLFDEPSQAKSAEGAISQAHPEWWVMACATGDVS